MTKKAKEKRKVKKEIEDAVFEDILNSNQGEVDKKKEILNFNFSQITLKNEKQKQLINKVHENQITFSSGPAGCGKTFIALKAALEIVKNNQKYNIHKILITKPIVEAGGESLGFLPGDVSEKTEVYMHSFYSNFNKLIGKVHTKNLVENSIIKSVPLPYMRGETFDNCIVILDEAQNTTVTGLKLFLSRIGENAKLIILGDIDQTDLKFRNGDKSGLEDAFQRFENLKGVAFSTFDENDIVRSSILIELMKKYKK